MHPLLNGISFADVIQPDQIYIFFHSEEGSDLAIETEYLYTIRNEQELIDGLTERMESLRYIDARLLDFLGFQRISEDCYQFTMRVMNTNDNFEDLEHFYLRRILTASEGIARLSED